jgi:hypothetical protein
MRKERYRAVRLGNRNGRFYCKDQLTGSRKSLKTTDRQEAEILVQHKNQATKNAHLNRKIGMAYLSTSNVSNRSGMPTALVMSAILAPRKLLMNCQPAKRG